MIEHLDSRLPRPYRPLAEPWKTSGVAARELPWAERQRRAAEEHARHEGRPAPSQEMPDPGGGGGDPRA